MTNLHRKEESMAVGAAPIGLMDVFAIGIGPSSSHTVGPMRAAERFIGEMLATGKAIARIQCDLFGSLALTGKGHATDMAVMLGLMGEKPESVDPDCVDDRMSAVAQQKQLSLPDGRLIAFDPATDIVFNRSTFLSAHPNALTLTALFADGTSKTRTFYSIGGGTIRSEGESANESVIKLNHQFSTAESMLDMCDDMAMSIADLALANERAWREDAETEALIDNLRDVMMASIDRGLKRDGILPGGLKVPRRAKKMHEGIRARGPKIDPAIVLEWVSLWALAVNEENASCGRVVTAPTNGAAGIIPAVIRYYENFVPNASRKGAHVFLLTATAIGILYKTQASVSAAELGCQGEVGVACSMAAAGLAAAMGASNRQIENAAEIGMEHNLGLTCDPIGGLVQIPCIERNAMGAIKAINAAILAMHGDGSHHVSLDTVIETMRQTGADMMQKYKETSLGGLAVNFVAC